MHVSTIDYNPSSAKVFKMINDQLFMENIQSIILGKIIKFLVGKKKKNNKKLGWWERIFLKDNLITKSTKKILSSKQESIETHHAPCKFCTVDWLL